MLKQLMMAKQVKSGVWEHFSVNAADESKGCCVICEESVSRHRKSTKLYIISNLRKHLMTKHPEQCTTLQQVQKSKHKPRLICWLVLAIAEVFKSRSHMHSTAPELSKSIRLLR